MTLMVAVKADVRLLLYRGTTGSMGRQALRLGRQGHGAEPRSTTASTSVPDVARRPK